ncbi:hypothetical protein ACLMAJ_23100 [Nocardia sp. KC 131]|uniref:hypothetical protein n=1 Tax=Nocardia arseniciresistens TaxID=3392119 RepID=UPI00398F2CF1
MNVHTTEWTMISDLTPESAYRTTGPGSAVWLLSWLPDRLLTREQALAGMELDEILSDPRGVHDHHAQSEASERADILDILWEQAVILLSKQILVRLRQGSGAEPNQADGGSEPATTGHTLRSHRVSLHPRGPVYG